MANLRDELAEAIESWLKTRKNSSLQVLSNLSSVPYSSIRRIVQKEVSASATNAMQIAAVIFPRKEGAQFILKHYPETGIFYADQQQNIEPVVTESKIRLSRDEFLTLSLAATEAGISPESLKQKIGERSEICMRRLLDAELIKYDPDGNLKAIRESFRFIDLDLLLDEIRHIADLFDESKIDEWGSLIRIRTEGFSLEAKRKAHKILTDADDALAELMHDKKNLGPYVMAYGIVSTFLSSPKSEAQP